VVPELRRDRLVAGVCGLELPSDLARHRLLLGDAGEVDPVVWTEQGHMEAERRFVGEPDAGRVGRDDPPCQDVERLVLKAVSISQSAVIAFHLGYSARPRLAASSRR